MLVQMLFGDEFIIMVERPAAETSDRYYTKTKKKKLASMTKKSGHHLPSTAQRSEKLPLCSRLQHCTIS
jgi:hypothetical protein